MKNLFVLAALLTVGTLSANAQTTPGTTTTTTRQTTTSPGTTMGEQSSNPSSTTTTTESTSTSDNSMSARTKNGKTMIVPADGAKVKGNGKKLKVK